MIANTIITVIHAYFYPRIVICQCFNVEVAERGAEEILTKSLKACGRRCSVFYAFCLFVL